MTEQVAPHMYAWREEDLAATDASREQMAAWDQIEREMQDEEAFLDTFRYTCPHCTNRRLEEHPRISTQNDTLQTRTYPVTLQEDEESADVFDRDRYVVNFDDTDLIKQAADGYIDGYFRRQLYCEEHRDETMLDYVGRGRGQLDRELDTVLVVD